MNKYSAYEVEQEVDLVEQKIRGKYNLPDNWYGDTYGSIIEDRHGNNLMAHMKHASSEEEYYSYLNEIKDNFECSAASYYEDLESLEHEEIVHKTE